MNQASILSSHTHKKPSNNFFSLQCNRHLQDPTKASAKIREDLCNSPIIAINLGRKVNRFHRPPSSRVIRSSQRLLFNRANIHNRMHLLSIRALLNSRILNRFSKVSNNSTLAPQFSSLGRPFNNLGPPSSSLFHQYSSRLHLCIRVCNHLACQPNKCKLLSRYKLNSLRDVSFIGEIQRFLGLVNISSASEPPSLPRLWSNVLIAVARIKWLPNEQLSGTIKTRALPAYPQRPATHL